LEEGAALYKKGAKTISGWSREDWFTNTLSTITHEVEHARFTKEISRTEASEGACKFEDVSHELSELAAIMSEFPVHYRANAKKPWHERREMLEHYFETKVKKPSKHGERIAGILKAIRCRCECADVNAYVKRTVEFTTATWTDAEKRVFHSELRKPKWGLDWPIETEAPPRDIPSYTLTPELGFGGGYIGGGALSARLGLDVGIPVDRLGKWQLLVGAQGRILLGLSDEFQQAYLLGLKVGFLKGPGLGESGLRVGGFGEVGGGLFSRQAGGGIKQEGGAYALGGASLGYAFGQEGRANLFLGLEAAGGARIDTTKPHVQKLFMLGLTFGAEF
jgi:hypothetical protein